MAVTISLNPCALLSVTLTIPTNVHHLYPWKTFLMWHLITNWRIQTGFNFLGYMWTRFNVLLPSAQHRGHSNPLPVRSGLLDSRPYSTDHRQWQKECPYLHIKTKLCKSNKSFPLQLLPLPAALPMWLVNFHSLGSCPTDTLSLCVQV